MTKQEELNNLYASQLQMGMQASALGLAGAISGVVYSNYKGYGFWSGVGFFFLGSIVVGIPINIVLAKKRTENAARILTLQQELAAAAPKQPSLLESLTSKLKQN